MDEPKSLDSLFKHKIFRIPDYQRGYAWQREQLKDFWEDLLNLSGSRSHYTGVLTLMEIPSGEIAATDKEYWLVDDHSYKVYHVVDGQQRLTTFVIFLQALTDVIRALPEHRGKPDAEIYLTDTLHLAELRDRYLFKVKPTGDKFRTYKFGYAQDNPSHNYLRFRIFGEGGGGLVDETFYTLNLSNAKAYFSGQLHALHQQEGMAGLQLVYRKLTKQFRLNEYVIQDDFDVFVAFETMNNRGKKLSDLELLKNRLIYLTTLYTDEELDAASRKSLRDSINDAWKEVYHQLGRNKAHPLNDDDFLQAHWTMFFKYSKKTGQDYIRFLLDEQFNPKRIHKQLGHDVVLQLPREHRSETASDDELEESSETIEAGAAGIEGAEDGVVLSPSRSARLLPTDIQQFIVSLRDSSVHWFHSFYPELDPNLSSGERQWIDRLNRIGMVSFRPLVMAVLKNVGSPEARIEIFRKIERFIFLVFRASGSRAHYGSSGFYNAARAVDRGELDGAGIGKILDARLAYTLNGDGSLRIDDFYNLLFKKFKDGAGYYGWSGLRYFLYEYELSLLEQTVEKKVDWQDLLKSERDKISIEHIYPQNEKEEEKDYWDAVFDGVEPAHRWPYNATLGNLLVLSSAINSSLQNASFEDKKHPRYDATGKKIRHGYTDGSHSEIEVSKSLSWGPEQIRARGIQLLRFMEKRWDFRFKSEEDRENLLFLNFSTEAE